MALATLVTLNSFSQVIISEFMASNTRTLIDEEGDYSDWIEIYNNSPTHLDLTGWGLTDDKASPRKWRFPTLELKAGQTIIVFASNKNRRNPGTPLHASFRLGSSGGFLGLSDAGGTYVFTYGDQYPAQVPDVSFGTAWEEERVALVRTNAPLKWLVPADGWLDTLWRNLEFEASSWNAGTGGIGYDDNPPPLTNAWISVIEQAAPLVYYPFQEATGSTATNHGSLGPTHNATYTAGPLLYQAALRPPEATGMATNNVSPRFDGRDDYVNTGKSVLNNLSAFTMSAWIKPTALASARVGLWGQHQAIEVGFVDARVIQLSTGNGGTVQADYPFAANQWHLVTVSGDGKAVRIYLDGVVAGEGGFETENYGASFYPLVIGGGGIFDPSGNWFNGFIDEFAFYDRALSADEVHLQFLQAKTPAANYSSVINSNVASAMKGVNSSVFVRHEFTSPAQEWDGLLLKMQADDGFAAFLNGVEVARQNVPLELSWNSSALLDRPRATGLNQQEFDLSQYTGLVHGGNNVLAVHGLNSASTDSDMLISAELLGLRRNLQTNSWRYFTQSSPDRINGIGETNSGPLVINTSHNPPVPGDADPLTITARMLQTFHPPAELTLTYRVMFGTEVIVPMRDDGQSGDATPGDGLYSAVIPANASAQGQLVRWYFRSKDTQGNTTRWPPYRDTRNSPQYLGTVINDTRLTNPLPVLHWFIQNTAAADGTAGTRASVFWNGVLYDNIFVNLHGQSSQGFPKKSYNMDFNTGDHLSWTENETPVEDINLLTTYPDKAHVRNILAYETFRDAGHPYHFVLPVRVQRNGSFFSDAHIVEDGDEEFLARVGLDPRGALYKMYNTLDSATSGVEKKSRKYENNTDLQALISGLAKTGTARTAFIYDNIDLPAMANYLAAMIITGNVDCCHKNYYLYRDSEGDGEWQFLPWDLDLSFGRNWTSSLTYYDDTMYASNPLFVGSNNALPSALFAMTPFRQMYLRRLRTLMDELMQPPGTPREELRYEKRMADLYTIISPDAALDFAKWNSWGTRQTMAEALTILTNQYMPGRRNYLFVGQRTTIPGPITNQVKINFGPLEVNPLSGAQSQEYFTLMNAGNESIDLSGWKIAGAVDYTFAPGMVLPPSATVYVSPDVNAFRKRTITPKGGQGLFVQGNYQGQLSARGETIVLLNKSGNVLNSLTYAGQPTPAQQALRITEVMYAPGASTVGIAREELEYVLLKNIGSAPLNLNGVHLTNGISFGFYSDAFLAPAESIYVAKNPEAFTAQYGSDLRIAGPYLGQLSNEGEDLELYDDTGEKILDLRYSNTWYPLTESQGFSLVIRDEHLSYSDWSLKENWTISPVQGGSAGISLAWQNYTALYFTPEELAESQIAEAEADPDRDGSTNYDEFVASSNPRESSSHFKIERSEVKDGKLQLTISAVSGRYYSLYSSPEIPSAEWKQELTLPRALQSGPLTLETTAPAGTTRYYRIRLEM